MRERKREREEERRRDKSGTENSSIASVEETGTERSFNRIEFK